MGLGLGLDRVHWQSLEQLEIAITDDFLLYSFNSYGRNLLDFVPFNTFMFSYLSDIISITFRLNARSLEFGAWGAEINFAETQECPFLIYVLWRRNSYNDLHIY